MKYHLQSKVAACIILTTVCLVVGILLYTTLGFSLGMSIGQVCLNLLKPGFQVHNTVELRHIIPLALLILSIVFFVSRQFYKDTKVQMKLRSAPSYYFQNSDTLIEYHVVKSNKVFAFTIGYIHPKIIISEYLYESYPEDELEAIILHEYFHKLRRDPLKIMILRILTSTFWFIPLLRTVLHYYITVKELMADRFVMNQMDSSVSLGAALLRMAKNKIMFENEKAYVGFTGGALEERIFQILKKPNSKLSIPISQFVQSFFLITIVVIIAGGCL